MVQLNFPPNLEVKMLIDHQDVLLELINFKEGDCFGESSVIGIQTHSSSAKALKATELLILQRQTLLEIFETDKEIFSVLILNIARETARRLHQSNEAMVRHMLKSKNA